MSREIDPEKIASGNLDEDEIRYLKSRNVLPGDWQPGDATVEAVEEPEDEPEPEEEEDDEEEDYEGWTAKELRAELATRDLSVDGKKDELKARLLEDDNQE